jgi:hypothetical protein
MKARKMTGRTYQRQKYKSFAIIMLETEYENNKLNYTRSKGGICI